MHTHLDNSSKISLDNYKVLHNSNKFLTIIAYDSEHNKLADLTIARIEEKKGLDSFMDAYEKANLIGASYIVVYELGSSKTPISRPSAKYQIPTQPIKDIEPKEKEFVTPNYSHETFEGLGGLGELMNVKESLYKKDFDLQSVSFQLKDAREKISKLTSQKESLDKENDELEQANQQLLEEVERLEKYEPKGATVMGFDIVSLGSAMLERGVKTLVKNNPNSAKGLFGFDDEQYKKMLNEFDGKLEQSYEIDKTSATKVDFEEEEDVSEDRRKHLEVSKKIYEWLKTIPTSSLFHVATVFEYFQKNLKRAEKLSNSIIAKEQEDKKDTQTKEQTNVD